MQKYAFFTNAISYPLSKHTFVLLETKPRGHEVTLGVFGAILNLASQEKQYSTPNRGSLFVYLRHYY